MNLEEVLPPDEDALTTPNQSLKKPRFADQVANALETPFKVVTNQSVPCLVMCVPFEVGRFHAKGNERLESFSLV